MSFNANKHGGNFAFQKLTPLIAATKMQNGDGHVLFPRRFEQCSDMRVRQRLKSYPMYY